MRNARIKAVVIGLAVLLAAGFTAYAASNYGSREDPLITKSYLDAVVQPELERTLREELQQALAGARSASGEFVLLTLGGGQRVTCSVGTELLLRSGSAKAYAEGGSAAPALADTTAGTAVSGGAELSADHLYMVTAQGGGLSAASGGARVLISGEYTVSG